LNEEVNESLSNGTNNDDEVEVDEHNDDDDDDDDGYTNKNTTKHDSILWRWAIVHKDKINDSLPKRRRRHRRSDKIDFTAEILPYLYKIKTVHI